MRIDAFNHKTGKRTWSSVFDELSNALNNFYLEHKGKAGSELYGRCIGNAQFIANCNWIKNFAPTYNVESIDPIHVFASINNNKYSDEKRIRIINLYFKILDPNSTINYDKIDFTGCPTPAFIHIIGARKSHFQDEIWEVFSNVSIKGQAALDQSVFDRIKQWYGVEIRSFTIFLFWIDSSNFLPLDSNTIEFLLQREIIKKVPRNYVDYKALLIAVEDKGYRLIALVAYNRSLRGLYENEKEWLDRFLEAYKKGSGKLSETSSFQTDFKIIAIKPLKGLPQNFRKVLMEGKLYQFYSGYTFEENIIKFDERELTDFHRSSSPAVNVCAVVGKNGTGKSTIADLLYLAINNIVYRKFQVKKNTVIDYLLEETVEVEFYVKVNQILKVVVKGNDIKITPYDEYEPRHFRARENDIDIDTFDLENWFYNVGVNYSLYSLNTKHLGPWIHYLFHKNDAYQAPIVLEPYRHDGNIDVNRQQDLVKRRLLTNLLEKNPEDTDASARTEVDFRKLTDKQWAQELRFDLNAEKTKPLYEHEEKDFKINRASQIPNANLMTVKFCRKFGIPVSNIDLDNPGNDSIKHARRYILRKLVSIACTYRHYERYFIAKDKLFNKPNAYVKQLFKDKSHITHKLRQAANFIKHENEFDYTKPQRIWDQALIIDKIKKQVLEERGEVLQTVELIPPPIFKVQIILNGVNSEEDVDFAELSSGEKQRIFAVNSVLYHLRNLDSVVLSNNSELISYRYVNLLMDEIELCFHPEMQRTYINYLLTAIGQLELQNIVALNICFITHSPFILSDIPLANIMFLESKEKGGNTFLNNKTFGANIHELLMNNFFMDRTAGEYALKEIENILKLHGEVTKCNMSERDAIRTRYEDQKKRFAYVIDNLGEKYYQKVLKGHIEDIEQILEADEFIQREIIAKKKEIDELEKKLKNKPSNA